MGKIPPSLRSAQFPVSLLRKQASLLSQKQQSSDSTPTSPHKPHHYPKKFTKKTPNKTRKPTSSSSSIQTPSITFTSPRLSDAKNLFNSLTTTHSKTPLDLRFCNSILHSFSAISALKDSISFLNHMIKTHPSFSPDRSTYHILLSQACTLPDPSLSSVHQALNLMTTHGFPPNNVSADVAIRALCTSGREEHAVELIKEFCQRQTPPDAFTYNFLVRHLVKNRSVSYVNSFVKDLRENFDVKPDLVTYTIVIDNVCNSKNLREASRLLEVLKDEGFTPDCYVYNTIMKGYCMLSQGGEVLGVYKKMLEQGVTPDLVTYNTLIFGLSKSGMVKEAVKFLNVMAEKGHSPDTVTYTSLMNGMCRQGNALGALSLLGEMELKGCTPNSYTYNTLLHGLSKSRMLEKGIELYNVMKAGGVQLETGSYATFLRALCRDGRVAEAYELFDYAVESKSLKDFAAYSTLESTLKWLKKAKEQGLVI